MFFFGSIFLTNFYLYLYGKIINNYFFKESNNSYAEVAIYGCVFVSFLAILINFFSPLNTTINTIILILPFLFLFKKNLLFKKDIKFIIISSIFVGFIIAFSNINTPDAGLYHLPYTQILNENKIIIGLNNLHFRFGHISIIQYLSAINYNLINNINGILIPLASLIVFIYLYFLKEVINFIKNKEDLTINNIFCLLVLTYSSYKINRYSGFGNDAVAHFLFFYLISIYLKSKENYKCLNKIAITATYIFLNKVTLLFAFIFPLLSFLHLKKKELKIFYSFSAFLLLLWLIKNVLVSSCLIYPIEKTCLNKLEWSNKPETIKQNISGEAWAKGWPNRFNKKITIEKFIKEFKWIHAWSSVHLKYILNILIPFLIFLILIIILINYFNKKKFQKLKLDKTNKNKILYSIIVLIFASGMFFLKFPLYRYGYSYLISLMILISASLIFRYDKLFIKKIFKYILILILLIISLKQFVRINKNFNVGSVWPNIYSFRPFEKDRDPLKKKIGKNYYIFISNKECMYNKAPCTNSFNKKISHKKQFGFDVIFVKD